MRGRDVTAQLRTNNASPWLCGTRALLLAGLAGLLVVGCNKQPPEPERDPASSAAPAAGGDKEDSEVNVVFFGTGAEGDPQRRFKEMFGQFDGDVGASATHETFEVHGMKVETVDATGTFKMDLTPPVGKKKQSPVAMVKQGYRLHAAVIKTPDRGNWFFRMTGPDATVQSARSAFRAMLESAK